MEFTKPDGADAIREKTTSWKEIKHLYLNSNLISLFANVYASTGSGDRSQTTTWLIADQNVCQMAFVVCLEIGIWLICGAQFSSSIHYLYYNDNINDYIDNSFT